MNKYVHVLVLVIVDVLALDKTDDNSLIVWIAYNTEQELRLRVVFTISFW